MTADPRADAFDSCLQRILNGEAPEQALSAYPQWAGEFRPMLETARAVHAWGAAIQAPNAAKARSRARFLTAALRRPEPRTSPFPRPLLRLGFAVLAIWMGLLLGGFTTVAASARALPGDRLYPVKRFAENTRLALVDDPAARMELEHSFDHERMEEVTELSAARRAELVNFAGEVKTVGGNEWVVGGMRVLLTGITQVEADITTGHYVNVQGLLQPDGAVLAAKVWSRRFEVRGVLFQTGPDLWMIAGLEMHVDANTQVSGALQDGAPAYARGVLVKEGIPHALVIESQIPLASPTFAPPTPTPLPSPTLEAEKIPSLATPLPAVAPQPTDSDDTSEGEDSPQPGEDDDAQPTQDSNEENDNSDDDSNNNEDESDDNDNEHENDNEDGDGDQEDNDNEGGDEPQETPEDDDGDHGATPTPTVTPTIED
jgi:hypothetical protein